MLPLCQKINDFENLITTIVDLFSVQRFFSFFLVVTLSNDQQNRTKINKRDREKKVAFFFPSLTIIIRWHKKSVV